MVEDCLCANSLDAIVANLTTYAFQAQSPWVGASCSRRKNAC
jgi:hypothetical protein